MTRDRTHQPTVVAPQAVREAAAPASAQAPSHGPDPVRDPDGYARTVLHHAITHGDLLEEGADGSVTIVLRLSRGEFERLASFDPDGAADREPVRVPAVNSPV